MRRLLPKLLCCAAMCWALAAGPARAQALQPLQAIRDAAITALSADQAARAMVAPGLRLAACSQPLVATASGAATAEVRCPDTPGWRLFVPVRRKPIAKARATSPDASPGAGAPASDGVAENAAESAAPAVTVKRGDPVVLRAAIGGTEVRMGGRALGPAVAGGTVNVENDSSHRVVRGRLAPDGTVEVVN